MTPNTMDRKRKHNGRFISTKSKRKRVSLTEYEKKSKTPGKSGEKREGFGWLERWEKNSIGIGFLVDQLTEACSECKYKIKFDKHRR